jgi:large conductance mechanosensitive channel
MEGFKKFLLRGNVVDLAIGVIIGASFSDVVSSFVKNLLTPLIAAIGGKPDFSAVYFELGKGKFMIGDFLNQLISFAISAAVIYFFVVLPMNRLIDKMKSGKTVDPTEKACPECLSDIPLKAVRCKYCTAQLTV